MRAVALLCAHLLATSAVNGVGQRVLAQDVEGGEPREEIRFQVEGLRSEDGMVVCGLFSQSDWLSEGVSGEGGEIAEGVAVCVFRNVLAGTYGVSAYHDENGNGVLDSNLFRIPKEGTAASNDARGRFGPPKFKDAGFSYEGGVLEVSGSMRYR